MLPLLVPLQTAIIFITPKRSLGSDIFAPNFWLSLIHFLRSFSNALARTKDVTSHKKTTSTTTLTRSSAAAAAALLKCSRFKRITKGSTCITLGITKVSIKCTGCKNVKQKYLKSRLKCASINSGEYKCTQPWVLIGKTDQLMQVYEQEHMERASRSTRLS
jgi:hypothetical protein